MFRPALLSLPALLLCARAAYVTPSFADRLGHIYEKLQQLDSMKPQPELYEKLEKLNSLTPEKLEKLNSLTPDQELTVDDEEMLTALQMWGRLDPDQLDGLVKELQSVREDDYGRNEKMLESDDSDGEWTDLDLGDDNPGDYYADEEPETTSTSRPGVITPSTLTRLGPNYRETVVSAVDPIAATNERPVIMDDSNLSAIDRQELRRAAFANVAAVVKNGKCSDPQARWFTVRHLAPAANIVYMPPCVQLYRCAPDSGCCHDEAEVCAPVAGKYVAIPFYLKKADGSRSVTVARMKFFNHTQCACVSRETLQTTVRTRVDVSNITKKEIRESSEEARQRQNDWRASTEGPSIEREDDHTSPPQLRRCTCPTLFLARPLNDGICSCVCEWPDLTRRRDCLSLARGREHFGMRDRVCVDHGDCNTPTCEYGPYEKSIGKCPQRRYRRLRYYHHRRIPDSTSD